MGLLTSLQSHDIASSGTGRRRWSWPQQARLSQAGSLGRVSGLIGFSRDTNPLVLALTEKESAIGLQFAGSPTQRYQLGTLGQHRGPQVSARFELPVLQRTALAVTDHEPARLVAGRQ